MSDLEISIPDDGTRQWLESKAQTLGYPDVQAYMVDLLRRAREEEAQTDEQLETLLLDGLRSGDPIRVTKSFWEKRHRNLERHIANTPN